MYIRKKKIIIKKESGINKRKNLNKCTKFFKRFVLNSSYIIFRHNLLKVSFFKEYVKEAVVFTSLILLLILVHTFGITKNKACCLMSDFPRGISNGICDLVLYHLSEG